METRYKPEREINISQEQHEILIGIMLGDAHLELAPNGKSARLLFCQMAKKDFYVKHLWEKLHNWGLSKIRFREREKGKVCEFKSRFTPTLLQYHKIFYDENKNKIIPNLSLDFTSRSLAYLFMDDGGLKSKEAKSVFINTYSLPWKEQEKFCNLLKNKFLLQAKVVSDRGDPRIFISGESYEILAYLLQLHILPGFEEKVPKPRSPKSRFRKEVPIKVTEVVKAEEELDIKKLVVFNKMPLFHI